MDRRAWQATVHGVTKSQTRLSTHTGTFHHLDTTILISAIIQLPPALPVNTFKLTHFVYKVYLISLS